MADTTFEEARRCPKCAEPGQGPIRKRPISVWNSDGTRRHGITPGAMLHEFMCKNERCRWFNTSWQVQINPDGTIPPPNAPTRARDRLRPLDPALAATMKDRLQTLQEATEISGGGEIRR
jgi:hypothetical protein